MSLLYIKCIFIHQGSVFSSFFLAFFKFSAFFSLFSSVRGIIRETSSFSFFLQFFSIRAVFLWFFFILQAKLHIFCFLSIYLISLWFFCFYGFNIFLSLPRLLSSFPSFWLTFLFFCNQSHFFLFYQHFLFLLPVFYPSSPFHTIFLPFTASPSRFYSFRPCLYYIFPFSVVFCLFSTHFYLFCFFRLFHRFIPSFCLFLDRPSFYRFYLCHFPRLIFHVSRLSKCFTWNIVFYDFRSSAISEKRFASRLSENHSHFSPLLFLKQSYFLFYFWFSPSFLHFSCIFARFTRFFVSVFSLLLNYLIIFLYFHMNWTFAFVFSDFPNHLLNAFWGHFFRDFCQSGRILSHSAVFTLLCVLLHHFSLFFAVM